MQGVKTHPVVFVAGATVLLISAMGVAGLTGLLPAAASKLEDPAAMAAHKLSAPEAQRARPLAQHAQAAVCKQCGVIESIRTVDIHGDASAQNLRKSTAYRITLRMDDGTYRTLSQPQAPRFAVGERARIGKGPVLARE